MATIWLFIFSQPAQAADSPAVLALNPLRSALTNSPELATISSRSDYFNSTILPLRNRAAQDILKLYLGGRLTPEDFDGAITNLPEKQDFLNTLQSVFFDASISHLRSSRSPAIKKYIDLFDRHTAGGNLPLFRLVGHYSPENRGADEKGGFHRAAGSIYANFEKISPSEWYIIFTHEILHSLDLDLWSAVDAYGTNPHVPEFASWAKGTSDFSKLSQDQQALLKAWIASGLDRGLWAEYRAWAATFVIYRDGLKEGLWGRIDWMESLLKQISTAASLEQVVYKYLDDRSADPKEEIFSLPLIQSSIQQVRTECRVPNHLPPLGFLGQIVEAR